MTNFIDMIASRVLSGLIQACEEMVVPPGSSAPNDAVDTAAVVVQAGLPAPGEVLPLAVVALAFIVTAAMIIVRAQMASSKHRAESEIDVLAAHLA